MSRTAHHGAHVPGREGQVAPVAAADAIDQTQAGARMHHVIVVRDHVEQRASDLFDFDLASANLEFAARQLIALEDVARHFAEDPTRHRHVTAHPALEQVELLRITLALRVAVQPDILVECVMRRGHRGKERLHHPRRTVAMHPGHQVGGLLGHALDDVVDGQFAHAHIKRRGRGYQVAHVLGMKRRVDEAQQRAEAVAENRDLRAPRDRTTKRTALSKSPFT